MSGVERQWEILDKLPVGTLIIDQEGRIRFCNRSLEIWADVRRSDLLGEFAEAVFPALASMRVSVRLKQVVQVGAPAVFSSELHGQLIPARTVTGEAQIQHVTATRTRGEDGEVFVLLTVQDLTDHSTQINEARRLKLEAGQTRLDAVSKLSAAVPSKRYRYATQVAEQPSGSCVLLVEDSEINAEIAVMLLEEMGIGVDLAVNGQEAIEAFDPERHEMVLMDCNMPVMDGFEATRRIRSGEVTGRRIPIIAVTARAMLNARAECLRAGMDDFLSKPFEPEQFEQIVGRYQRSTPLPSPRQHGLWDNEEEHLAWVHRLVEAGRVQVRHIEEGAATGNLEAVAAEAHAIKGTAAMLQIPSVVRIAGTIEERASHGQSIDASLVGRLDRVLESLVGRGSLSPKVAA